MVLCINACVEGEAFVLISTRSSPKPFALFIRSLVFKQHWIQNNLLPNFPSDGKCSLILWAAPQETRRHCDSEVAVWGQEHQSEQWWIQWNNLMKQIQNNLRHMKHKGIYEWNKRVKHVKYSSATFTINTQNISLLCLKEKEYICNLS